MAKLSKNPSTPERQGGSAIKAAMTPVRRRKQIVRVQDAHLGSDDEETGLQGLQSHSGGELDGLDDAGAVVAGGGHQNGGAGAGGGSSGGESSGGESSGGEEERSGSGDDADAAARHHSGSGSGSDGGAGPSGRRAADGAGAASLSDVPQLLSLLAEMRSALGEVRARVEPLTAEVRAGRLRTEEGLSYLEAKHLLLVQYCACLVVYVMLRAEGRPVEGHPVVTRLVQLRAFIERTRPIDKQLAYQIEKLLRATEGAAEAAAADAAVAPAPLPTTAQLDGPGAFDATGPAAAAPGPSAAASRGDGALRYRPNPAALVTKAPLGGAAAGGFAAGEDGAAAAAGVYRPPRLNPVAMEEDREASRRERRQQTEVARRAKRSSLVRELAQELAGAPEEVEALLPGLDSAAAQATKARLEARAREEEDLMMRVPLSKRETKVLKAQRRAGLSGQGLLDDFADEVADLVGMAGGGGGGGSGGGARKRGGGGYAQDGGGSGDDGPGFEVGRKRGAPAGLPDNDYMAASRAARAAGGKGGKRRR